MTICDTCNHQIHHIRNPEKGDANVATSSTTVYTDTISHACSTIMSHSHNARAPLKCFKNQPTILKIPTSFTITRQLNQTFQRNRLNTSTLLTTPNKQTYPSHPSPPFNATTQPNVEKNDRTKNTG